MGVDLKPNKETVKNQNQKEIFPMPFKSTLERIDWILTERGHATDLAASGSDPSRLLFINDSSDPGKDSRITELRVWAPSTHKLTSLPARLGEFKNLRCLAIGPGIDPHALDTLKQNDIPATVIALGIFTSGLPASWPVNVQLPNVLDLRTDGPLSFRHANFPNLRAVSLYPTRNGKNLDAILACKELAELQLLTISTADVFTKVKHLPLTKLGLLGGKLTTLLGIEALGGIECLRLHNLRWLTAISPVSALEGLEELEIRYCKHIEDIERLAELPQLRRLQVIACGNLGLKKIQSFIDKLDEVQISASS